MPTYEYRCKDCGERFSLFMSITQHDLFSAALVEQEPPQLSGERVTCPNCGAAQLEQQMSAFFAKTSRKS